MTTETMTYEERVERIEQAKTLIRQEASALGWDPIHDSPFALATREFDSATGLKTAFLHVSIFNDPGSWEGMMLTGLFESCGANVLSATFQTIPLRGTDQSIAERTRQLVSDAVVEIERSYSVRLLKQHGIRAPSTVPWPRHA